MVPGAVPVCLNHSSDFSATGDTPSSVTHFSLLPLAVVPPLSPQSSWHGVLGCLQDPSGEGEPAGACRAFAISLPMAGHNTLGGLYEALWVCSVSSTQPGVGEMDKVGLEGLSLRVALIGRTTETIRGMCAL